MLIKFDYATMLLYVDQEDVIHFTVISFNTGSQTQFMSVSFRMSVSEQVINLKDIFPKEGVYECIIPSYFQVTSKCSNSTLNTLLKSIYDNLKNNNVRLEIVSLRCSEFYTSDMTGYLFGRSIGQLIDKAMDGIQINTSLLEAIAEDFLIQRNRYRRPVI